MKKVLVFALGALATCAVGAVTYRLFSERSVARPDLHASNEPSKVSPRLDDLPFPSAFPLAPEAPPAAHEPRFESDDDVMANIVVHSDPPALVWIDHKLRGLSPVAAYLPEGWHRIEAGRVKPQVRRRVYIDEGKKRGEPRILSEQNVTLELPR